MTTKTYLTRTASKPTPVVAVDFDGTLAHGDYPAVGELELGAIALLRAYREAGGQLVLWTCRSGEALAEATWALAEHGLTFDAVNAEAPATLAWMAAEDRSPKIFANLYVDDRASADRVVDWRAVAVELDRLLTHSVGSVASR